MTSWRMTAPIDDIRGPLAEVLAAGEPCAIATLVAVDGSAPRDAGAQMLVTAGEYWGFLSGGCIEADVARHGREAMAEGTPRSLRYGEGSPWIDIKLACGSGIDVLVEPVAAGDAALAALVASHATRQPVVWSSDGTARLVEPAGEASAFAWNGSGYARLFAPTTRLLLIGEDGAALSAAAIALEAGMEVALVTPGGPDAPPPLDGIIYHRCAPAEALATIGIDQWTAIAVLSHDREDDERGLAAALASPAFYVGAIGARARLDARLAKLRGHGVSEAEIARLHAPIGLQGFGKSPREIALSLVAEVAQAAHARAASARSAGVSISSTAPRSSVSR
ncbi:MAG: XdhC family protein [Erythrobacter sp.]|uniref:XdhC family protein n=1 Tax=Erythrobacter sp. TaxID=1042 RepID=UPI002B4990C4|nr:XdhC family protein [Erythrobacter sp.]WRH70237.1 MAG: XdhC family protein [Erythrobacter sp.]